MTARGAMFPASHEELARAIDALVDECRLDFDGPVPRAADISARWHSAIAEAREVVRALG